MNRLPFSLTALALTLAACDDSAVDNYDETLDVEQFAAVSSAPNGSAPMVLKEGYCSDRVDNDRDGRTDSGDSDCQITSVSAGNGFAGTTTEGTDIYPRDMISMHLDGASITVTSSSGNLYLKKNNAVFATVYLDSEPRWIGVGDVGGLRGNGAAKQEFYVCTTGGTCGYALGQSLSTGVSGNYTMAEAGSTGGGGTSPPVVGGGGSTCTVGCP